MKLSKFQYKFRANCSKCQWKLHLVLNRLYIVVGVLAILVLGAGFLVPRLMDWNGYRARLETLAEEKFGTDIIIGGEINFTLLPQPQIRFGKTIVGPAFSPLLEIDSIVADLSLVDFLRDRFTVTKLVLQSPIINIRIDKNGETENPIQLPQDIGDGNISIADAQLINGTIRVSDARADKSWEMDQFEGELSISDVRGPFNLKGLGVFRDAPHALRLSVSAINQDQLAQASFFWRPSSGEYVFSGEGLLELTEKPNFTGIAEYKSAPLFEEGNDDVRGDFVFTSEVEISPEKILLTAFELQPDENQAGSRLTGAAVINLGENLNFDAVISGGVVSFAPKDIREESISGSDAFVEFLANLSTPIIPSIPGRLGIDIAELNVQGFSLRDVRLDTQSVVHGWQIENFSASLPGESEMVISGLLSAENDLFGFLGSVEVKTQRLGQLARLWGGGSNNADLQNSAGTVQADIKIVERKLNLSNGTLYLDEKTHSFEGGFGFAEPRFADFNIRIAPVDDLQSDMLIGLLPQFVGGNFWGESFPNGHISASSERASVLGMPGQSLALELGWSPEGIAIDRFSAFDLGARNFPFRAGSMAALMRSTALGGGA